MESGRRLLACVCGLALSVAFACEARATEPDGSVAIGQEWVTPTDDPGGSPRLRVSVRAYERLAAVQLVVTAPGGVAILAERVTATGTGAAVQFSTPGEPLSLGDLASGATAVIEFVVERASGASGIASITVIAVGPSGLPVRESAGVPIGVVGTPPTPRNGALEFPAGTPQADRP